MALKRTLKPFYGKAESRLERTAADAMRAGNRKLAAELFDESEARQKSRFDRLAGRNFRRVQSVPRRSANRHV